MIINIGVNQMVAAEQGRKTLADLLNKHVRPFQDYVGPIPETVPAIRQDGRTFASGNVILKQRLDALTSQDKERIVAWGKLF